VTVPPESVSDTNGDERAAPEPDAPEPDAPEPVAPEPVAPEPDDKDWTWTLTRVCPECGFDAAGIERVAIPALIRDAISRFPEVLARPDATERPTPQTWSALEYACHVRDVCRVFTERLELMQREDHPHFANWNQDATALEQRYGRQDPQVVSGELAASGEAAAVAFTHVRNDEWERDGSRSNGSEFTVESLGRYFLHELFHHVWDLKG